MRKIIGRLSLLLLFTACGRYAWFPPEVSIPPEQKIGLIQFSVKNAEGGLDVLATDRFLEEIIQGQRGVRLLELGTLKEVLADVGAEKLDAEAIRKVGTRHGVDSVFTGEIRISDVKPQVSVDAFIKNVGVRASFTIYVSAKLQSTDSGAVLWADSVERKGTVAYFGLMQGEIPYFGVEDKDEANRRLIAEVIYELTWDFRPTRRRI
jgi:TolB-like protein